jgi:hypothetical protein
VLLSEVQAGWDNINNATVFAFDGVGPGRYSLKFFR